MSQTPEYIDAGEGYLAMFSTGPGEWVATVQHLVCEESKAVCIIDFVVGADAMTGISLSELADGLIARVTDFWPEPCEPPPRSTPT